MLNSIKFIKKIEFSFLLLLTTTTKTVFIYTAKCQRKLNYPHIESSQASSFMEQYTQYCLTKESTKGICIRVSECRSAKKNLSVHTNKPNVCYWDNLEPIVCCNNNQDSELITETDYLAQQNSYSTSQPSSIFQQKYVTHSTFSRDYNKPISVRPPTNHVISQDKNYHLMSTVLPFKRKDLPPNLTTTTTNSPSFKTSNNSTNQIYKQSFDNDKSNGRDGKQQENNHNNNHNDKLNKRENDENVNSSRRRNSRNRELPQCGKRINMNNLPANRIVKGRKARRRYSLKILSILFLFFFLKILI